MNTTITVSVQATGLTTPDPLSFPVGMSVSSIRNLCARQLQLTASHKPFVVRNGVYTPADDNTVLRAGDHLQFREPAKERGQLISA